MSKMTVASLSCVVGACCGALLLSNHRLISGHPSYLQVIEGPRFQDDAHGVVIKGSEPPVPPIKVTVRGGSWSESGQTLDGLACEDCSFRDATLEYSGGTFSLVAPSFSGKIMVNFKGAAANTAAMISLLEGITSGTAPKPFEPNKPQLRTATAKIPVKINWASPYGRGK